jgi:hypothetical protein
MFNFFAVLGSLSVEGAHSLLRVEHPNLGTHVNS